MYLLRGANPRKRPDLAAPARYHGSRWARRDHPLWWVSEQLKQCPSEMVPEMMGMVVLHPAVFVLCFSAGSGIDS